MAKVIVKIFHFLGEGDQYGWSTTSECIQECFEQCPGMIGLDEFQFTSLWTNQTIKFAQLTNVFALIFRIKEAQKVSHDVACVSCKMTAIHGIRFKCQQCRKLSLCFDCFCRGFESTKHSVYHRMYEISAAKEMQKKSSFRFWSCCRAKPKIDVSDSQKTNRMLETKISDDKNVTTGTTTIECINETKFQSIKRAKQLKDSANASLKADARLTAERLTSMADSIESQANEIKMHLRSTEASKEVRTFIRDHHTFLVDIVKQLKELSAAQLANDSGLKIPHSSTPYRSQRNIDSSLQNSSESAF